jgi:N utilization substance protein B
MLSRRNIRIKIMQFLYAAGRDESLQLHDLLVRYQSYGKKHMELFLYSLAQFVDVAHYAVKDEVNRKAKMMPTPEDRAFKPKLYLNDVLLPFVESKVYRDAMVKYAIAPKIDEDITRNLYSDFMKTDSAKQYLAKDTPTQEEHRTILSDLYRFLAQHEMFNERMEEIASWIDDKSLIVGTMKKLIKTFPSTDSFSIEYLGEDRLTYQFGDELLMKTHKKDEEIVSHIKPMLENWDIERVTAIDMVLLKMAISEMLYFPTIPTKVTINEYVDISKTYSTDKSKEFVNGVLDRLMKKLKDSGEIRKEGRGLVDE